MTVVSNKHDKPKKEKTSNEDEITISKDELASLVQKQIQEHMKTMNKVDRVKGKEIVFDHEDALDDPCVFFCYSNYFAVFGDVKNSQEILTPYKRPLRFKPFYRYKRPSPTGRGQETVSVSRAIIHSKKEAQYLRDHSLFGVKFFENIGSIEKVDVTFSEKMIEINNVLNKMDDVQIIARAKKEIEAGANIQLTSDVASVRKQLREVLANRQIKQQKKRSEETAGKKILKKPNEEFAGNVQDNPY